MPNHNGKLPVECAIASGRTWDTGIGFLLDAFPSFWANTNITTGSGGSSSSNSGSGVKKLQHYVLYKSTANHSTSFCRIGKSGQNQHHFFHFADKSRTHLRRIKKKDKVRKNQNGMAKTKTQQPGPFTQLWDNPC
jgi:hypothetical protein